MEEQSAGAKTDQGGPLGVLVKDLSQHMCLYLLLWRGEAGLVGWVLGSKNDAVSKAKRAFPRVCLR